MKGLTRMIHSKNLSRLFAALSIIIVGTLTFSDAANQAGMSRRYGGIHFEQGDLMGRAMGRKVAAVVWDKAQGYMHGNA